MNRSGGGQNFGDRTYTPCSRWTSVFGGGHSQRSWVPSRTVKES
jgi:hypothetical protein